MGARGRSTLTGVEVGGASSSFRRFGAASWDEAPFSSLMCFLVDAGDLVVDFALFVAPSQLDTSTGVMRVLEGVVPQPAVEPSRLAPFAEDLAVPRRGC